MPKHFATLIVLFLQFSVCFVLVGIPFFCVSVLVKLSTPAFFPRTVFLYSGCNFLHCEIPFPNSQMFSMREAWFVQGCVVGGNMFDSDSYLPNFSNSDLSKISDSGSLTYVNEVFLSIYLQNIY